MVDDAIVMLENITRHIEEGMKPFDAAIKGSSEIAFAIVAMTLTLASVYAPIAFVEGVIGQLFIEFAVALAGSVLISGIVALTLSPMMCSRILKLSHDDSESRMHKLLLKVDAKYASILHKVLHMPKLIIGVVIGSVILSYGLIKIMPPEIVPKEDRGLFGVWIGPIPGESMDDMETHSAVVEKILFKIPEAKEFLTFMGSWGSSTCVNLKDFSKRSRSQEQIKTSINSIVSQIPSLDAYPWSSDSGLPGMEISVEGNNLSMAVSTTGSYQELSKYAEKMVGAMNGSGKFMYAYHDVKFNTAGYDLIFDRDKLASLQIDPQAVSDTVGVFFSGNRNLRFHKEDVGYSVTIDGEQKPWSLDELYITDSAGNRISIGSFAKLEETINMANLPHYNQMRAATISGAMLPFVSIESIMPDIMQLAQDTFPKSYKIEWTGAAQIAKESTGKVALMFIMAIIFIYAILSVQFDNFLDPFVIMTTVPLACSGGLLTSWFFGQSFNIYTQIGLITLVGLITKHGILIVDFANKVLADHHPSMRGDPVLNNASAIEQAVTRGAITRLRPILMTTGAMILGSFPLVFSSGAGSEARTAIGIVIVGGLGFGTFFTLFVLPRIYCWVKGFAMRNYH